MVARNIGLDFDVFLNSLFNKPIEIILKRNYNIIHNFFFSLKEKIYIYGDFFISTPYNMYLNNVSDKHDESFLALECVINFNKFNYKNEKKNLYNKDIYLNLIKNNFFFINNYYKKEIILNGYYNSADSSSLKNLKKITVNLSDTNYYAYVIYLHNELNNFYFTVKPNKAILYLEDYNNYKELDIKNNFKYLRNKFFNFEKNITVEIYEDIFKFYFFDPYCPEIKTILMKLYENEFFSYSLNNIKKTEIKHVIQDNIYNIKTLFNFLASTFILKNENFILYLRDLETKLKNIGVTYSLIYDINYYNDYYQYYFFSTCVNPRKCFNLIKNYILSYVQTPITCILSFEDLVLDFSELCTKKLYCHM